MLFFNISTNRYRIVISNKWIILQRKISGCIKQTGATKLGFIRDKNQDIK